ncbi:MAG: nitric-oxide reductase large subunit [Bacteroidota bacterium]
MRKVWTVFWFVIIASFAVLGWAGLRIYQQRPPIPTTVVTADGQTMLSEGEISAGQNIWQAMGGMQLGSVWGHGSYVAPDWTAEYLHRECMFILNEWAEADFGTGYEGLHHEQQAALQSRLTAMMRNNSYDETTGILTVHPLRLAAFQSNLNYYSDLFITGNARYAIPKETLKDASQIRSLTAFYFWTSWAASTNRPGEEMTYTSNWPHEPLIRNIPTSDAIIWTGVSIILLLAGIGGMVWYHGSLQGGETPMSNLPSQDPLFSHKSTPSQKAVLKYFWTVSGLILVQIGLGVVTAHYGVEGDGLYGIPISEYIPYVITRTWHTQLAIFWIATAWLAAGLYIAPAVSGIELKGQKLGVNILFGALLLVVVGSLTGQWLSINHRLGDWWFYLGHQGYEYVDLGRIWQIALLAGLLLWVYLVGRHIVIGIRRNEPQKPLLTLFLIATAAIGFMYAAGLVWGKTTNLAITEYWRWWVVHLWVEGFFEVFATVVIAFMFARMQLIRADVAGKAVVVASTIFLAGGIVGTLHHLYFSGTPTAVLALGSVFSALEVVPLVLVGFEAWENIRLSKTAEWVARYKWPIYFFIAVAFWNMVGAGLFGFMINPPIALYYMQGLNTTAVHAHAALFGVYGMLGIGLMLFCLRILWVQDEWNEKPLKFSFWALNIGLFLMVVVSLLPIGLMQTWASVEYGYWYARSSDFLYSPTMTFLKWTRVLGDTILAAGAVVLVLFVFGLVTGHSLKKRS